MEILYEKDPRHQKSLARKVTNFDETEWNKVSQSVVKQGSLEKVILHGCVTSSLLIISHSSLIA